MIVAHQILFGLSNRGEEDGRDMWHVWGRREINRFSVGKAEVKKSTWKN
jgi:hypothetical protein